MKTLKLSFIALMLGITAPIMASAVETDEPEKDTILVNFGKKGKMVIYVDNKEDFNALKAYDINTLLNKLNLFPDSTKQENYMEDTAFTFHTPYTVNGETTEREVRVRVESLDDKVEDIADDLEKAAENVAEAAEKLERVTIDLGKLHVDINEEDGKVKVKTNKDHKKRNKKSSFEFYLGLNNYFQGDSWPVNETNPYTLDTWRSRYFALDYVIKEKIVGTWTLTYGVELAFNNYMFMNDVRPVKVNDQIVFEPILEREVRKSKLATTYLNVPIMTRLSIGNLKLGVGGYVGYRLGSHGKVKYTSGDNIKEKDRSNFYLDDWRYGLRGLVGFKQVEFFANYDLNTLFKGTRGPQLNSFSFGIIL